MKSSSLTVRRWVVLALNTGGMAVALMLVAQACQTKESPPLAQTSSSPKSDAAASRAAFLAAYPVFMHPRCVNCHPRGDQPLQGEDSHIHAQNVQRGPDGKGLFAMKCANCHQEKTLSGANMPPSHPEWHLPPANMRMVFEGVSAGQLARQLKDPKQNGGKTLEQIIHHVTDDSLVGTAWHPGEGRSVPPLTQAETGRLIREWVEKGAAVPE